MSGLLTKVLSRLLRWPADRRGAMSPLFALMIVPIVGVLGLAAESSGWFYTQRSLQNAADSAARAAATAAGAGGNYVNEGAATATKYGYTNGTNNTTVATTNVACPGGAPAGATTCYQVALTKTVPIYLTRAVGFQGSGALGSGRGQIVRATAIASRQVNYAYCNIALNLSGSNNGFQINGGSSFDLGGCDVFSNASAQCNGSGGSGTYPWGIASAVEVGSHNNKLCGGSQVMGASPIADPYGSLSNATDIPRTGCVAAPSGATSTLTVGTSKCYNTPWNITGAVTVTTSAPGGVIYMDNTSINLGSSGSITAAVGSGLTIVFTGTAGANAPGFITGSGTMDFGAPTTGTWKGVALYQDKRMTGTSNLTYSGNSPTFNLTGLIYAPYAAVTYKGAINHQTGGLNCLAVIADSLLVSGTGSIFANSTSQCQQAGLNLPTGQTVQYRVALVQ